MDSKSPEKTPRATPQETKTKESHHPGKTQGNHPSHNQHQNGKDTQSADNQPPRKPDERRTTSTGYPRSHPVTTLVTFWHTSPYPVMIRCSLMGLRRLAFWRGIDRAVCGATICGSKVREQRFHRVWVSVVINRDCRRGMALGARVLEAALEMMKLGSS